MFEETVTVKLKCSDHPEFNPNEDYVPKGCKCCDAINFVKGWLELAQKKANQIDAGFYARKAGQVIEEIAAPAFSLEDICDVATVTPPSTAAPDDEVALVPETHETRLVKRKGVGGGRLKVKSAPQKPKFQGSLL